MASLFNSKHNKYVSIPDWFKDVKPVEEQKIETKTTYIGGGGVSSISGLSNITIYNKFVLKDAELDNEALVIKDIALNGIETEEHKIGDEISAIGWNTTEYTSIAGSSTMTVTSTIIENQYGFGVFFYDNTLSHISNIVLQNAIEEVIVPANAYYFRISVPANDESFNVRYNRSEAYNSEQLVLSNKNITDYLTLNDLIPEGKNETVVSGNSLKLLVQSPLSLTKDVNNVVKLSIGNIIKESSNDMFVWDKKLAAFGYDEVLKQAYSYVDGQQQFDTDGNPVMTNNPDFWMYDENLADKWIIKSTRPRISWLDNLFEYDSEKNCFVLHGNLATTGGIVMYADAGDINIDDIYDGLPIDRDTIYWENGVLKSKGGTGGIEDIIKNGNGNSLTDVQLSTDKKTLIFYKNKDFAELKHVQDNFVSKDWIEKELKKYVTLRTEQEIYGKKNFTTGGLFVNNGQIIHNDSSGYWKLEGDLIVTGGITMYANDSSFDPYTVMDAITVDNVTISKDKGYLEVIKNNSSNVKIVQELPSDYEKDVLYVIVP